MKSRNGRAMADGGSATAVGEVVEWLMAPVLKTGEAKASVGSNPTLSVSKKPDTAGVYKLKRRQRYPLRRLYQAAQQTRRKRGMVLSLEVIKHGLWVGPPRPTEQVAKS